VVGVGAVVPEVEGRGPIDPGHPEGGRGHRVAEPATRPARRGADGAESRNPDRLLQPAAPGSEVLAHLPELGPGPGRSQRSGRRWPDLPAFTCWAGRPPHHRLAPNHASRFQATFSGRWQMFGGTATCHARPPRLVHPVSSPGRWHHASELMGGPSRSNLAPVTMHLDRMDVVREWPRGRRASHSIGHAAARVGFAHGWGPGRVS
jgi:hypothetical protein